MFGGTPELGYVRKLYIGYTIVLENGTTENIKRGRYNVVSRFAVFKIKTLGLL